MEKEKKQMNAIHMDDLNSLLKKLGLYDKFISGEVYCKFCKSVVTYESIYSVLPDSGTYHLVDDKADCVSAMLEYIDEKNKARIKE